MQNNFEAKVTEQVQQLRNRNLRTIEVDTSKRRVSWVHLNVIPREHWSPRQVYELLFFDYMGLSEDYLPVISESDEEIVWLSKNPCPTLEACKILGLDTRKVCRASYEKSTQVFLSQLDPSLRFLRDYREIRPYAPHCKERIVRVGFHKMMRLAIEEAKLSLSKGNKGYGALVVMGTEVIAKSHDTASVERDPSLHAEINALREAFRVTGDINLSGAILFATCEPCPMCASLAVWSNISAIVYGASIVETAALGRSRIMLEAGEIAGKAPITMEVMGGILREECLELYK